MGEADVIRRGPSVRPKVDTLDIPALLADIEAREFVALPDLGSKIGMGKEARKFAIHEGVISPAAPLVHRRDGYKVTRDEALTILLAAALAVAAGVAIVVMLRGVKQTGLTGEVAAATLRQMMT
jgi:hypothetical protein